MSGWLKFGFLWMLTGSPVTAALILVVLGGVTDWYALGIVRRAYGVLANARRGARLQRELAHNPANQKVRHDLGEVLVERHSFQGAIQVLKPILEEEPGDLPALLLMGLACLGAGKVEQGELFLTTVESTDPRFRQGAATLALGRARLGRGDARAAVEPLRRYLAAYASSVEGHYLLARALKGCGDDVGAGEERERTWREYATALPFQRRADRRWAWRVRPWRPALYGLLLTLTVLGASFYWQRAQERAAADVSSAQVDGD
jgi:tetratricopeptide (TPR) repeat protein